jgi:hypothetical protein
LALAARLLEFACSASGVEEKVSGISLARARIAAAAKCFIVRVTQPA